MTLKLREYDYIVQIIIILGRRLELQTRTTNIDSTKEIIAQLVAWNDGT